MPTTPTHKAMMRLHQPVDAALAAFAGDLGFSCVTTSFLSTEPAELQALTACNNPQAAIIDFHVQGSAQPLPAGVVIAEPFLCSEILERILSGTPDFTREEFRATPQTKARTAVEIGVLQQFLADVTSIWRDAWVTSDIRIVPKLAMATTLQATTSALAASTKWHVARTIFQNAHNSREVGVLLFCYPHEAAAVLNSESARISWRARIERGLSPQESATINNRINQVLGGVKMPSPVNMKTSLPIRLINQLEEGDVISFDATKGTAVEMAILDRNVNGILARSSRDLAVVISRTDNDPTPQATTPTEGDQL